MNKSHSNVKMAIALYLLMVFIFLYYKPLFLFNEEGELKTFGTGPEKTLLPLWAIFGIFAIISYLFVI